VTNFIRNGAIKLIFLKIFPIILPCIIKRGEIIEWKRLGNGTERISFRRKGTGNGTKGTGNEAEFLLFKAKAIGNEWKSLGFRRKFLHFETKCKNFKLEY
jgi:hypothetical protein